MNNLVLNELYNKIIELDLSEYTHQKLYDLCFKLDEEIERLNNIINEIKEDIEDINSNYFKRYDDDVYILCNSLLEKIEGDDTE